MIQLMAASEHRERLAALVAERRQRLQLSVSGAARIARVSRGTWIGVENATRVTESYNYAGVERVLQWRPGSVEAILDGGDPVPLDTADRPAEPMEPMRYYHPELGEIVDPQDVQLWEADSFDEETRVGFIFQARAKRMREQGGGVERRATG